MPCRDGGGPDPQYEIQELQEHSEALQRRLDTATRLLCGLLKVIEEHGHKDARTLSDHLVRAFNGHELAKWWSTHKKEDKIRREKLRVQALQKLTAEELEVLGRSGDEE